MGVHDMASAHTLPLLLLLLLVTSSSAQHDSTETNPVVIVLIVVIVIVIIVLVILLIKCRSMVPRIVYVDETTGRPLGGNETEEYQHEYQTMGADNERGQYGGTRRDIPENQLNREDSLKERENAAPAGLDENAGYYTTGADDDKTYYTTMA